MRENILIVRLQLVLARLGVPGRKGAPAEHKACTVSLTAKWNHAGQRWSKHHFEHFYNSLAFFRSVLNWRMTSSHFASRCKTWSTLVDIVLSDNFWISMDFWCHSEPRSPRLEAQALRNLRGTEQNQRRILGVTRLLRNSC